LAYGGKKKISWLEVLAGEAAFSRTGSYLPPETLQVLADHRVSIKGPLSTPVGGGFRSLNVTLRQTFDLYACIRPVRYYPGVPTPVRHPEKVNMVVFRENTEDVYAGLEWASESREARELIAFIREKLGRPLSPRAAIGIKPMTPEGSRRLIRMALTYALAKGRKSVTLVHKGNIMKFTEGGFRAWGYDLAREAFSGQVLTEEELAAQGLKAPPPGTIILKDRIADMMFQQVLLRPEEYDVLAAPNLNGDYLSDALAAQVGGLGMAPGANLGDGRGMFEATHGSAPRYRGLNQVNPTSLILSGAMMLEYLDWKEASNRIDEALKKVLAQKTVTYDLARQLPGAKEVSCSTFGELIMEKMGLG
jgi:isocitrate dehydrogenase